MSYDEMIEMIAAARDGRKVQFRWLSKDPNTVRYVRADGVIDGSRLQCRRKHDGLNSGEWKACLDDHEFRFRP